MRTANKNKQKMYYALKDSRIPVYDRDKQGNIRYIVVDGESVPVTTGDYTMGYGKPIPFKGNITMSSGEINIAEFGVDVSNYDAILIVDKGEIPITETSLIWFNEEPTYEDAEETLVKPESATYRVIAIKPSLNGFKAVLKRIVK